MTSFKQNRQFFGQRFRSGNWPRWLPEFLLIAGVAAVGLLPRIWNLSGPSMWNDEGSTSYLAISILKLGYAKTAGPPLIQSYDPLMSYVVAISFALFGVNQFAARLPSVIIGTALIPLSYAVGKSMKNSYVGFAFAVEVSLSTELISWSRQSRGYILFLALLAIGLYILIRLTGGSLTSRRRYFAIPTLVAISAALFLVSPGIFLLYSIPAGLACLTYIVVNRQVQILKFLLPGTSWEATASHRVYRRYGRISILIGSILVLGSLLILSDPVSSGAIDIFRSFFGFKPYPFRWVPFYGSYLLNYYPAILGLAVVGLYVGTYTRRAIDLALGVFAVTSMLALSLFLSVFIDVARGAVVYERYMLPLLWVLLYFAGVGLWVAGKFAWALIRATFRESQSQRPSVRRAMFCAMIGIVLVVPSLLYPSPLNLYPSKIYSPTSSLVEWVPFSPDPVQPSALFGTEQPNYELASTYIRSHEISGDVVMAIWPDAPAFYLGSVQLWAFTTPPPGSGYRLANGSLGYWLTGSWNIGTSAEFDAVVQNNSGWFIEDVNSAGALGQNFTLAVNYLTQQIALASDDSIRLYYWNQSSPIEMLESIWQHRPDLQVAFGTNLTRLVDWAATSGVSTDGLRQVILPIEAQIVPLTANSTRPLATLLEVFNNRPDLQVEFPSVVQTGNFSDLLAWAKEVVTGQISDPAYPTLEPYASYYEQFG